MPIPLCSVFSTTADRSRARCAQITTALGQWRLRGYGLFAVEADPRFAGQVGVLHPLAWPGPELAYALDASFRGRGLAAEAVTTVRDRAFQQRGSREWRASSCRQTRIRRGWQSTSGR